MMQMIYLRLKKLTATVVVEGEGGGHLGADDGSRAVVAQTMTEEFANMVKRAPELLYWLEQYLGRVVEYKKGKRVEVTKKQLKDLLAANDLAGPFTGLANPIASNEADGSVTLRDAGRDDEGPIVTFAGPLNRLGKPLYTDQLEQLFEMVPHMLSWAQRFLKNDATASKVELLQILKASKPANLSINRQPQG